MKFNWSLIICSLSLLLLFSIDEVFLKAISILFICMLYGAVSVNISKNLVDPRVIFVPFLGIYQSFYVLQLTIIPADILPYSHDAINTSLNLSIIFISITSLILSFINKIDYREIYGVVQNKPNRTSEILSILIVLIICYTIFALGISSGATTKRELMYSGASQVQVVALFGLFYAYFVVLIMFLEGRKKYFKATCVFLVCTAVFSALIQGERDPVFRLVFLLLFLYFSFKRNFTFFYYLMFFSSVIIVVPFSQLLKGVFLSGNFDMTSFALTSVLGNEFISAGRNLYAVILYSDGSYKPFLIFNDFIRGLFPKFIIGDNFISSTNWYNNQFRLKNSFSGSSGWGFSIIAQSYLVFGYVGVILSALFTGGVLKWFYHRTVLSARYFAFYMMLIITFIYVIRADYATLFSQGFKLPLLCFGAYFLLRKLLLINSSTKSVVNKTRN